MYIPLVSRVDWYEWPVLVMSVGLLYAETVLRVCASLIPARIIAVFNRLLGALYSRTRSSDGGKMDKLDRIRMAADFPSLCRVFGYEAESHLVVTADGYILTLHRVPARRTAESRASGTAGGSTRSSSAASSGSQSPRVVYLHHGLLMCSEIWVTMREKDQNLPFVLADLGYDVWLGNNRGNKYSQKHMTSKPFSDGFWDFSLDEFALRDVPNSVEYILKRTGARKLSYIGFSQGSAQGFAALSAAPELVDKVNCMVALSPALTPSGLRNHVVDSLMRASPFFMYLFFGRKAVLPSAAFWQKTVYPPLFARVIDACNRGLFGWTGSNIARDQKLACYAHLYSATSVKTVVHWFQIIRTGQFQMYDGYGWRADHVVPWYPTTSIREPVLLVYGGSDSLVDIDVMKKQLPDVEAAEIAHFEHLDTLWAENSAELVFPKVVRFLEQHP